uniref:C-type lectin domain-containing protein n=1 Tax=Magallana gigas TaxID=29159 RepID=A0A8W8P397_MAGGI|nr:perlucin-like protein [Crassostrea gigas]
MIRIFCFVVLVTVASTERACDNGWLPYNNHCYWLSPSPLSFNNAVDICSKKGSNLIEIKDAAEEKWVFLQSRIRRYKTFWIGLTDVVNQNEYVYSSSGTKPIYTNWDKGQPQIGTKEDCAALPIDRKKWHDYPCSSKLQYICRKPANHYV